jgi:hypothetical protein
MSPTGTSGPPSAGSNRRLAVLPFWCILSLDAMSTMAPIFASNLFYCVNEQRRTDEEMEKFAGQDVIRESLGSASQIA